MLSAERRWASVTCRWACSKLRHSSHLPCSHSTHRRLRSKQPPARGKHLQRRFLLQRRNAATSGSTQPPERSIPALSGSSLPGQRLRSRRSGECSRQGWPRNSPSVCRSPRLFPSAAFPQQEGSRRANGSTWQFSNSYRLEPNPVPAARSIGAAEPPDLGKGRNSAASTCH